MGNFRKGSTFPVIAGADSGPLSRRADVSARMSGVEGTTGQNLDASIGAFVAKNRHSRRHKSAPLPGISVSFRRLVGDVQAGLAENIGPRGISASVNLCEAVRVSGKCRFALRRARRISLDGGQNQIIVVVVLGNVGVFSDVDVAFSRSV